MSKNHLFRDRAPITEAGWREIEKEARRTLRALLAARRVVDFRGPLGWETSDVELGRADSIEAPPAAAGVRARLRRIQPMVELRIPFDVSREELDAIDRGARDPDLDSVIAAAREIAIAEDRAIFHGYEAAHIRGICERPAVPAVPLGSSHGDYPGAVASALTRLRDEGIEGPFAVVLNEQLYKDLASRTDGGYPIISHVRRLVDGDIVWAPGLDGGLVISLRGGDFELSVGQDFSIGYLEHDPERVRLYIEESFTFLVLTEQAAIPLSTSPGERAQTR
ncbi:MAG: family 1 encapsulin nanocompartment shell protein [Reyranellaceae bacterium]